MIKVWYQRVVLFIALSLACLTANAAPLNVALRYVALRNSADQAPIVTIEAAQKLVSGVNQIFSQCAIQFTLEDFQAPLVSDVKLALVYEPSDLGALDDHRKAFDDGKHALVVMTGAWDRSGTLGNDGSNGWSSMPPSSPEGTVIEQSVATNVTLVAHELGHSVTGLDHVSTEANLMDHFVGPDAKILDTGQCAQARDTIEQYHKAWLR